MILVDTSVWIEFFRKGNDDLLRLLEQGAVLIHPFVVGELACCHLEPRQQILADLGELPLSPVARNEEVLLFIEQNDLMGSGIGYLDMHLLASAKLGGDVTLWTYDKKLSTLAAQFLTLH